MKRLCEEGGVDQVWGQGKVGVERGEGNIGHRECSIISILWPTN